MSRADPAARSSIGRAQQAAICGAAPAVPKTLMEESWRDYVFAEVWARPALDRRSRFLIAIAGAACAGASEMLENYLRGALTLGDLGLAELREAALHLAVYAGWSRGDAVDQAATRIAAALGLPIETRPPIRAEPWDPAERLDDGSAGFVDTMTYDGPPPTTAYFEAGILNFVFGEMWTRPGLDQRSRRWITLVGVAESSSDVPIRSHVYSAMASGNATVDEMNEFVLQYAIHGGWPKASVMQGAVFEMAQRLADGLTFS